MFTEMIIMQTTQSGQQIQGSRYPKTKVIREHGRPQTVKSAFSKKSKAGRVVRPEPQQHKQHGIVIKKKTDMKASG